MKRFQLGLEKGKADFNVDFSTSVAVDSNQIDWHHGPHCMNCYLGQKHECWDPQYAKEMDNILRRVFFVKNAGGQFELATKRTGVGDDYAVITYCVRYAPQTKQLPHHNHPRGEEYFVLRGSFDDHSSIGFVPGPAMTYVKYPKDTEHHAQPNFELGCDVLTWWGQNNNDDEGVPLTWWSASNLQTSSRTTQSVDTTFRHPSMPGSAWCPSPEGVGYEMDLFRAAGPSQERTWMFHMPCSNECESSTTKKLQENESKLDFASECGRIFYTVKAGGLELYVVKGSFEMGGTVYKEGFWLRESPSKAGMKEGISICPSPGTYIILKENHLLHL